MALDAIGPYQVLSALPGAVAVFVAERAGSVCSDSGCSIIAELPLAGAGSPDIVVVPGSLTSFTDAARNESVVGWLREVSVGAQYMTSVCTGALLLTAAGLLAGRTATTHWAARDLLGAPTATTSLRNFWRPQ
ncbi:MAG TPA: DJ-1/PfpI family protein [Streptosporangiaceae bacterium]|nr:DJ-1/PfpI family protein [Streptosporangiaceae bacterium]